MLELYQERGPKRQATAFPCVTPPANGSNICKVKNMTKRKVQAVYLGFLKRSTCQPKEKNEQAAAQHFFSVATKFILLSKQYK